VKREDYPERVFNSINVISYDREHLHKLGSNKQEKHPNHRVKSLRSDAASDDVTTSGCHSNAARLSEAQQSEKWRLDPVSRV